MFAPSIAARVRVPHIRFARALAAIAAAAVLAGGDAAAAAPRTLTLAAAVDSALARDPVVLAATLEARATGALARDAVRRPPARLEVEAENWGGPADGPGLETTAGLGWTLELGGDRGARGALAGAEVAAAAAALEAARRDARAEVTAAFADAWAAQERLALLRDARLDALAAVEAARERLRAGAAPAVEVARAESDAARAEASLALAAAEAAAARRALALRWLGDGADADSLALPDPAQAGTTAQHTAVGHPALALAEAGERGAAAGVRAARARRTPDLDVRLGVRHFQDERATGFVAGIELPLGTGGSGELDAARARLERAALERAATTRRLDAGARDAASRLEAALAAWRRLSETAAPRAVEALALLGAGYRAGRFGYVDLVEGRRAALEAREALVDAAAAVWRARAELERHAGAATARGQGEESR